MNTQMPSRLRDRSEGPHAAGAAPDLVDMGGILRLVWRRKWIVIGAALAAFALALVAASQMTPMYTATAQVMLDTRQQRVTTTEEVVSEIELSDAAVLSEVAIIRSNLLLERVVRALGLAEIPEFSSELVAPPLWRRWLGAEAPAEPPSLARIVLEMKERLDARQEGISYVISISFTAKEAALAARIANAISQAYIEGQLEERSQATRRATAWLDERVSALKSQVQAAEAAVEAYKAENLALEGGGVEAMQQQLIELSSRLAAARADRLGAEARARRVQELVARDGLAAAADVAASALIGTLRERRAELQQEAANLATRYGPAHEAVVHVRAQHESVEAALASEVEKYVEGLRNEAEIAAIREQSLAESVRGLEGRIIEISQSSIQLRQLEREAEALRLVYESLLARVKETRTQEAIAQADARIVSRADLPEGPSSPRTKLLAGFGGVMGAALGLAIVFLLEIIANTFRSSAELESSLRLPVLASIPLAAWRQPARLLQDLEANPFSPYAERIRQLRTALMFARADRPPKTVMITSSTKGEGKTTTALALAHMSARMGKAAIIVDCDLRRPFLHQAFAWDVGRGDLVSVLQGQTPLEEAIYRDEGHGFDILPTAHPMANAADALSSDRFARLLAELAGRYDLVLIDTPPILAVSDACVIGRHVDSAVYLVRWNHTEVAAVKRGIATLADLDTPISGIAFTMVRDGELFDYYAPGAAIGAPRRIPA